MPYTLSEMWITRNGGAMPGSAMPGGAVQPMFDPQWPGMNINPLGLPPVAPMPNPALVGPALVPVMQVFDAITHPGPTHVPAPVHSAVCHQPSGPDSWHPDGTPIWPKPPGAPVARGPNGTIVAPTPSLPTTPQGVTNQGGTVIGPAGPGAVDPRRTTARKWGAWAAILGAGAAGLAMIGGA